MGNLDSDHPIIRSSVHLITLPAKLEQQAQRAKIKAEIVARNMQDGTLTLKTDYGEIKVKLRNPDAPQPVKGDIIEIEIPPKNAPSQAVTIHLPPPEVVEVKTPEPVKIKQAVAKENLPLPERPPETAQPAVKRPVVLLPDQAVRLIPIAPDMIVRPENNNPVQAAAKALMTLPPPSSQPALTVKTEQIIQRLPLLDGAVLAAPEKDAPQKNMMTLPVNPEPLLDRPVPQIMPENRPFKYIDVRIAQIVQSPIQLIVPETENRPASVTKPETLIRAGQVFAKVEGFTVDQRPVLSISEPSRPENPVMRFVAPPFPTARLEAGDILILNIIPDLPAPSEKGQAAQPDRGTAPQQPSMPSPTQPLMPPVPVMGFPVLEIQPGTKWPVLEDIRQILNQNTSDPVAQMAAQNFVRVMPASAAPGQMLNSVLFFIAALRSGDLGSWLSERASDILRQSGRGDLMNRLSTDGQTIARLADAPAQDWRGFVLPFMHEDRIEKILLWYRQQGDQDKQDESGKKGQTRFVLDLDLDRLGAVQLDGLMQGQRLDLVVRTQEPFSAVMQQEMRRKYASAINQADMFGELHFQSDPSKFLTITPDQDHWTLMT